MVCVVCKYTPFELFAGFGEDVRVLDGMARDFDLSDTVSHVNLCGFGKSVIQASLEGRAPQLVLVNCCDVMRRSYEIIEGSGSAEFVHLMDLPHSCGPCQIKNLARQLKRLKDAYARFCGKPFNLKACQAAFCNPEQPEAEYVAVLGVRAGREMQQMIEQVFSIPVRNLTCTGNRRVVLDDRALAADD